MSSGKEWETLFAYAVKQLQGANISKKNWSFGGGTVLNHKYHHRASKDIDIFFREPQFLNYISPRINDAVEDKLKLYSEAGHHVRLQFQEGEIDFIVAQQLSSKVPSYEKILGEHIYVDNPVEIIAKKIHYRAEEFKPRDVFDLAIVFGDQKNSMLENSQVFAPKLETLEKRISDLDQSGVMEPALQALDLLPGGEKVRGKEVKICFDFIEAVSKKLETDKKLGIRPDAKGLTR